MSCDGRFTGWVMKTDPIIDTETPHSTVQAELREGWSLVTLGVMPPNSLMVIEARTTPNKRTSRASWGSVCKHRTHRPDGQKLALNSMNYITRECFDRLRREAQVWRRGVLLERLDHRQDSTCGSDRGARSHRC